MNENSHKSNSPSCKRKVGFEAHTPPKSDDCNIQYGGASSNNEGVLLVDTDNKYQSTCMKFCWVLSTLTVEPAVFSYMFAYFMIMSLLTNMMMDKGCLYRMNYSKETCSNLSNYDSEKKIVEVLATDYYLYINLTNIIAAFAMIFIAPWSDKYSRRIPLIVCIIGTIISDIGVILCTIYFESELDYLILAKVPMELTGGIMCVVMIGFSHSSEITSEKTRTLKLTTMEVALGLGKSFGGLAGGFMYKYYSYLYVYVTVTIIHVICLAWIVAFLKETRGLDVDIKWHEKAKNFFSCHSFKEGAITICKPREGKTRAIILLLLLTTSILVLNYEVMLSIAYVYVHHVYNWDPTMYNIVNTSAQLTGLFLTLLVVPVLVNVFKLKDFTLGIIGTISMMLRNLFVAFSRHHKFLYYIAVSLGTCMPLGLLAVRTGISKVVDKDELGRMFAFLCICEAVVPVVGSVGMTKLFNATLDTFPNATYTLEVILLIIPLGIFIWSLNVTKNTYSILSETTNDHAKEKKLKKSFPLKESNLFSTDENI